MKICDSFRVIAGTLQSTCYNAKRVKKKFRLIAEYISHIAEYISHIAEYISHIAEYISQIAENL